MKRNANKIDGKLGEFMIMKDTRAVFALPCGCVCELGWAGLGWATVKC